MERGSGQGTRTLLKGLGFIAISLAILTATYFPPAVTQSPLSKDYKKAIGGISIDFSRRDLPEGVLRTEHISGFEGWGRWTDGAPATLVFKGRLPRKVLLAIDSGCVEYVPGSTIEFRIGDVSKVVPLETCGRTTRSIVLDNPGADSTLYIRPSTLIVPSKKGDSSDDRQLGLSLFRLDIADAL